MWDLIAMAAGIGFGLMGISAYIKTNLEARKREKELQNLIGKGQMIDPRILIQKEKDLIDSAKEEIWILGINALGVFHESFENLIHFTARKGKVRVLLLEMESEAFKQREKKEEGIGGEKSGRLRKEYATSIAFCKDIIRLSKKKDSLELRVYKQEPMEALLIADPKKDTGMLHVNEYPSTEHVRGYVGEHRFVPKNWPDIFQRWIKKYEAIWENSEKISL
ncbi:MAG: hypothetical protein JRI46_09610 [Deltaproteobacteria bacterium]|nr:hypothetical protein [Deltaproteobacteria bacterium]